MGGRALVVIAAVAFSFAGLYRAAGFLRGP